MDWYFRQNMTIDGRAALLTLLQNARYINDFAKQVTYLGLQLQKPLTSVLDSTKYERQRIKDVLNGYMAEDSLETTILTDNDNM